MLLPVCVSYSSFYSFSDPYIGYQYQKRIYKVVYLFPYKYFEKNLKAKVKRGYKVRC